MFFFRFASKKVYIVCLASRKDSRGTDDCFRQLISALQSLAIQLFGRYLHRVSLRAVRKVWSYSEHAWLKHGLWATFPPLDSEYDFSLLLLHLGLFQLEGEDAPVVLIQNDDSGFVLSQQTRQSLRGRPGPPTHMHPIHSYMISGADLGFSRGGGGGGGGIFKKISKILTTFFFRSIRLIF